MALLHSLVSSHNRDFQVHPVEGPQAWSAHLRFNRACVLKMIPPYKLYYDSFEFEQSKRLSNADSRASRERLRRVWVLSSVRQCIKPIRVELVCARSPNQGVKLRCGWGDPEKCALRDSNSLDLDLFGSLSREIRCCIE